MQRRLKKHHEPMQSTLFMFPFRFNFVESRTSVDATIGRREEETSVRENSARRSRRTSTSARTFIMCLSVVSKSIYFF